MLYRVTRGGTFLDVFEVEAKSPEDAVKHWQEGKEIEGGYVLVAGTAAEEVLVSGPTPAKVKKTRRPRKKKALDGAPVGKDASEARACGD